MVSCITSLPVPVEPAWTKSARIAPLRVPSTPGRLQVPIQCPETLTLATVAVETAGDTSTVGSAGDGDAGADPDSTIPKPAQTFCGRSPAWASASATSPIRPAAVRSSNAGRTRPGGRMNLSLPLLVLGRRSDVGGDPLTRTSA